MKLQIITSGYLECNKGFITLGKDMGKIVKVPVFVFLIRHPEGNVLIDTGISSKFKETWGKRLNYFIPILKHNIVEYLKDIKISYIINTHLHIDHCENNPFFKHAEIIVQRKEYETACNPKPYQRLSYSDRVDKNLNYRLINTNLDLFEDKTIKIIKTPGHTEGHQSVLLNLTGKKIFIAGDSCYTSGNLKNNILPGIIWNADKVMECYEMIRNLKDTLVIFGHEETKI